MLGLLEGVHYLHTRSPPIIHGDLHDVNIDPVHFDFQFTFRPKRNIVISNAGDCMLCDFGLSRIRHEVSLTNTIIRQGGNYRFAAPEISFEEEDPCIDEPRIDERSDVYSLAVTIYALGTRSPPFEEMNPRQARRAAKEKKRPSKPNSLGGLTGEHAKFLWCLMQAMWAPEPQQRPTISTARAEIAGSDLVYLTQQPTAIGAPSTGVQHWPMTSPPRVTDESVNQHPALRNVDERLGGSAIIFP